MPIIVTSCEPVKEDKMYYCQPCKEQGHNNKGVFWCMTCPDILCDGCHGHHKALKATRNHDIRTLDEYKVMGKFINDFDFNCKIHQSERLVFYCFIHDTPICLKCRTRNHGQHGECHVKHEDDLVENSNSSSGLTITMDTIEDLVQKSEKIIQQNEIDEEELNKIEALLYGKLQADKNKMKRVIEEHEEKAKTMIREKFQKQKELLSKEKELIEQQQSYCSNRQQILKNLDTMKLPSLQKFLLKKHLQDEIQAVATNKSELSKYNDEKIESFEVIDFFQENINEKSFKLTCGFQVKAGRKVCEGKDEKNQMSAQTPVGDNTFNINMSKKKDYQKKEQFFVERKRGCVDVQCAKFLQGGDIIVMTVALDNRFLVYRTNGYKVGQLSFCETPGQMAVLHYSKVAVAVFKKLFIVDIDEMRVEDDFFLRDVISNVSYANGYFYACLVRHGIVVLNCAGETISRIPYIKGNQHLCITPDNMLFYVEKEVTVQTILSYNLITKKGREIPLLGYHQIMGLDFDGEKLMVGTEGQSIRIVGESNARILTIYKNYLSFPSSPKEIGGLTNLACSKDGRKMLCVLNRQQIVVYER